MHDEVDPKSRLPLDPVSFDELEILDAENKRLKTLLAKQLRIENGQLKQILARFGT